MSEWVSHVGEGIAGMMRKLLPWPIIAARWWSGCLTFSRSEKQSPLGEGLDFLCEGIEKEVPPVGLPAKVHRQASGAAVDDGNLPAAASDRSVCNRQMLEIPSS